jgi:hypothetical protein
MPKQIPDKLKICAIVRLYDRDNDVYIEENESAKLPTEKANKLVELGLASIVDRQPKEQIKSEESI